MTDLFRRAEADKPQNSALGHHTIETLEGYLADVWICTNLDDCETVKATNAAKFIYLRDQGVAVPHRGQFEWLRRNIFEGGLPIMNKQSSFDTLGTWFMRTIGATESVR